VNAVNVELAFRVQNRQGNFSVTVDATGPTTIDAVPGQTEIVVPIGKATEIGFHLQYGNSSFDSLLTVHRFTAGAGAFIIEALPIALVYPPIQGKNKANSLSYTDTTSVGVKMGPRLSWQTSDIATPASGLRELADAAKAASLVAGSLASNGNNNGNN